MTWQKLEQFVKDTIRPLKGRKREQAAFAIAALCFSGGFALGGKLAPEFKADSKWIAWVQVALYVLGAISFVYGAIRVWRLVHPPELPPAKDRPSAIKGPMAFTEADGELFRKLGRESELQILLGMALDDQLVMVVVRGASGAGKTSLLRAGLKHILKNNPDGKDVQFHYWEAVPTKPDEGLLRAIQEKWPEGAGRPASLDELVNPADALGRQQHIIVLDQFEQLRGSRKMFALLRRIVRESRPPHRITWVIAFRREFSADWMDFVSPELERGFRPPQDVSLRLFTADQAREVIGQLVNESNLKDSIEQSVINNLVEAATVEGEISPVDIGIGLLVLAELHERQSGNTITIRDYQFAGGAEGLLTQYISRCLDLFPKENQEAILKAMLALRDAETNQRLAEGRGLDELAMESGAEARLLKTQLDRLSHRDTRLLETVTPTDGSAVRYRLPHERLIPALYRLTGKLLAEVDQAKLKFQNAFQAWKTNDKRLRYLLRLNELRLVRRYETQIPWGNDQEEKKNFLYRSKRRSRFIKIINGIATVTVVGMIWIFWEPLITRPLEEVENYLEERAYYSSLFALQGQMMNLKKLEITRQLDPKRLTCSSFRSLEELSLIVAPSGSFTSLSECYSLKKLKLDLYFSEVRSLEPLSLNLEPLSKLSNLTHLTLNLGVNNVDNLEALSKLSNLTHLTLGLQYSSQASNLETLSKLTNLRHLTLSLGSSSQEVYLEQLSKLKNLTELNLSLSYSQASNLRSVSNLSNLTHLTLDLSNSKVSNLEPISKLSNLTYLALNLNSSPESNLESLSKLSNLRQLTLTLGSNPESYLEQLSKLSNLTHLTLDLSYSKINNLKPLLELSNLTEFKLTLGISTESNLEQLSKLNNLTQLTLDLGTSQVGNLEPLSKLSNLTHLTLSLSRSQGSDLEPLSKLRGLIYLTLDFGTSPVSNLEMLSKLSNLTELTFSINAGQVRNLEGISKLSNLLLYHDANSVSSLEPLSNLSNLRQLTLNFYKSQESNLEPLSNLNNLRQLALNFYESRESTLEPLSKLTRLQSLSIGNATRAQRMSLRNLPASLVELKF